MKKVFGTVVTVAIILVLGAAGCAEDDKSGDDNGTTGGVGDTSKVNSGLVLGANEMWVYCHEYDDGDGGWCERLIFHTDGSVLFVKQLESGAWVGIVDEFTWSVSGNKIILKMYNPCTGKMEEYNENGLPINYTYGISGNTLTVNRKASRPFTVTDVNDISIYQHPDFGDIINSPENGDNRLILPNNKAWMTDYRYCHNSGNTVYTVIERREGYIFRADGGYVDVMWQDSNRWDFDTGLDIGPGWKGIVYGIWSTNENELTLSNKWGYNYQYIYTVSDNNLTFELSKSFPYTKTDDIVLTRIYDSWEDYWRDNNFYYSQSKRPTRDHPHRSVLRRPDFMGGK